MQMFLFEGKTLLIDLMQWQCSVTICSLHIFQNSWQINLPAWTEEAVCSSTAFRWVYICHFVFWLHLCRWFHFWWMLCLFRRAFLSAVCFGRTDNGSWECRGVRFWNRFRLLHVNAWFWMLPWVLTLRNVFRFGNGNWAQQVCLRKQCYFGKLSREVRARTTRERREWLYESYRAVSMVDGSPRAPSEDSVVVSKCVVFHWKYNNSEIWTKSTNRWS